jgi:hypothetical protein
MALDIKLVNPLHIKQMPGRKSDAKDAQWIVELLYRNMLRQSGTLSVDTGVAHLHPRISQFGQSAHQSFDSYFYTKYHSLIIRNVLMRDHCIERNL